MSLKSMLYKFLAAMIVLTILGGCTSPTPQPTATPTTAPTDTLAPTVDQNLINTQAAQTATANAPTETPVTPTSTDTEAPTATATISSTATIAPTSTPLPPTAFPTWTFSPFTLTPSATQTGYACTVTSTTPKSTDTVKVSTNFDFSWVIKNTGSKLWGQHNADVEYVSGKAMQTKGNVYDFTKDVKPGTSYTATVAMKSPATAGTYSATWKIVQDGVDVCSFSLSVKVVN